MSQQTYLRGLFTLASAVAVAAVVLYFAAGQRWFGFYGPATLVLSALPVIGWLVAKRYSVKGLTRWPVLLLIALIAIAAIVQIAFWAAFFSTGADGLGLAAGRAMILPLIEPWLPAAALFAALLLAWAIGRGVYAGQN